MPPKKRKRPSSKQQAITVGGRRCLDEFNGFLRGGLPGLDRLQAVYTSIFRHFAVRSEREQTELLLLAGLRATGPKSLQLLRASSLGWSSPSCADSEF